MASLDSLDELLREELKDIYDAERQLTKALPKLVKKASAGELRNAFEEHLRQTRKHVERLEHAFEQMGMPVRGKKCEGMQHLIAEGDEMIADAEDDATRDAVMIAAAQKVEHYEIASYGCVATYAELLGYDQVHELLGETLDEEERTDERLSDLAESVINVEAADESEEEEEKEAPVSRRGQRP